MRKLNKQDALSVRLYKTFHSYSGLSLLGLRGRLFRLVVLDGGLDGVFGEH